MSKKRIIAGYATIWGERYPIDNYHECVLKSALDGVSLGDCRLLYNHDKNKVLARTKSGTLKITLDALGLRYRAELPDTPLANEIIELMERGDLGESSWAFSLPYEGKSWSSDGKNLTITRVTRLWDVSLVTYPACEVTSAWLEDAPQQADPFRAKNDREEMARELERGQMALELSMARYKSDKLLTEHEQWKKKWDANAPDRAAMAAELRRWEDKLGVRFL